MSEAKPKRIFGVPAPEPKKKTNGSSSNAGTSTNSGAGVGGNSAAVKPKKAGNEEKSTLDTIHQFQVRKILTEKNDLSELQEEYESLAEEIEESTDEIVRGQLELRLEKVQKLIDEKTRDDNIYDYFLKTGPLLFDYYEMQNAISKGEKSAYSKKVKAKPGDVLSALQKASAQDASEYVGGATVGFQEDAMWSNTKGNADESVRLEPATQEPETLSDWNVKGKGKGKNETLLEKYLQKINPAYVKKTTNALEDELGTCSECGKEMIFAVNDSMLYCSACNYSEFILIDSDRPSYKDPPCESSYYAYKRINHFNELLAHFQAKENTAIDEGTFDLIKAELKKQRVVDMTKLTNERLREILKKLKLNKLYDHTNYILSRLNGTSAQIIDRDTEEKLRHMFREIQPSFQKHIPKDRRNFLAYPYVLYKFCELLEMDSFLKNLQLLKNRDKLYVQDKTWEKICADMGWQFIPTV
jgi:ribosomal protein S27AE